MTGEQIDQPQTEQEAREANARIKQLLRWSSLLYTPIVGLILWVTNVPYWGAVLAGFFVLELISYPLIARSVDRNTELQIEAIRERDGAV